MKPVPDLYDKQAGNQRSQFMTFVVVRRKKPAAIFRCKSYTAQAGWFLTYVN